tara:strand:- start:73 stop:1020 length:948 start_codon:yes stop_codon:yes gene_type:complete
MITLGFRNKLNKKLYVDIHPNKDKTSEVWLSALNNLLYTHKEKVFQKNFSLLGLPTQNRSQDDIILDLKRSVRIVNENTEYNISEDFVSFNQETLNRLHHHFELLQGQLWNPSSFLASATGKVRCAICYLNHCCHELEAYYDSLEKKYKDYNSYFYYNLLGVTERKDLPLGIKEQFVTDIEDGMVYLHYAQTGKTWYEAYLDNDLEIDPSNISEHRVITGEFNLYSGPGFSFPTDSNFKDWLEAKNVDPNNADLALGYAPVAHVDVPYTELQEALIEYDDFYSIEFNNKKIEYNYRHTDPKYVIMLECMWDKWNV